MAVSNPAPALGAGCKGEGRVREIGPGPFRLTVSRVSLTVTA
jgi:hypothetical protein